MTLQADTSFAWLLAHQAALVGYLWWDHRRAPSPRGRMPHEYRVYYVIVGLLAVALLTIGLVTAISVGGWSGAALAGRPRSHSACSPTGPTSASPAP